MAQAQFEALLEKMMSEQNNVRKSAENAFKVTMKNQPNEIFQALIQVGRTSAKPELRSFSILTARNSLFVNASSWTKLNAQTQNLFKRELLAGLEQEQEPTVRAQFRIVTVDIAEELLQSTHPP